MHIHFSYVSLMLFTESAEVRMCPPIFRGIFKSKIPMNVLNTIHFNKISKNIYGYKNLKNLQKLQIDCLYFFLMFLNNTKLK